MGDINDPEEVYKVAIQEWMSLNEDEPYDFTCGHEH